jgi:hypothetical protein
MSLLSTVLNLLLYKEPPKYDRFELLEDEPEDKDQKKMKMLLSLSRK